MPSLSRKKFSLLGRETFSGIEKELKIENDWSDEKSRINDER
jgi:hypothetical protein